MCVRVCVCMRANVHVYVYAFMHTCIMCVYMGGDIHLPIPLSVPPSFYLACLSLYPLQNSFDLLIRVTLFKEWPETSTMYSAQDTTSLSLALLPLESPLPSSSSTSPLLILLTLEERQGVPQLGMS